MILRTRPREIADLDSVYAIEIVVHRTPWSHGIFNDCILVGYDCRVIEIQTLSGNLIAGYIISRFDDSSCHILNLSVTPKFQGQGYGQLLIQQILDSLAGTLIHSIVLEVRPSNLSAIHLYEKMGFQQCGIKPGYYRDGESVEDAFVLEKKI